MLLLYGLINFNYTAIFQTAICVFSHASGVALGTAIAVNQLVGGVYRNAGSQQLSNVLP